MGWYKILKKTVYEKNGNINKKTENLKIYQNLILSLKSANKIKNVLNEAKKKCTKWI